MDFPTSSSPLESLAGLIERVTFYSEETGFAVLRVQVAGQRELVTVVGSLPAVAADEWLTAEGRWQHDREHGRQLKAERLHCTAPYSREGIERSLGSGLIKGICPTYPRKLVERFSERVLDIIDTESGRLKEIEGIGPGRRRRIKEAWAEQRVVRDIMVFLHAHGVSTSRAVRIYKTYGDASVETGRANFIERDNPDALAATLVEIVRERIPRRHASEPLRDIQVLTPMNRGSLGARERNRLLQHALHPPRPNEAPSRIRRHLPAARQGHPDVKQLR